MSSSLLLNHGIDLENHTVNLVGEVDLAMYNRVLLATGLLGDSEKVTFVLNTTGGVLNQAFGIYDLIKTAFVSTKIICSSEVMSAGTIILSAGDERVAYPSTQFLIHYGEETNSSGTEARHNANLLKRMKDIIAQHTVVKRRTLNSWFNKETHFDAKHALEIGLIQRVVQYE